MEIQALKSRSFPSKDPNVRVSNSTNCPVVLLQIWDLKSKFPVVSLAPNSHTDLPLPSGAYRFDFTFVNTEKDATLKVTIETPSETVEDSGSAKVGRRGILAPVTVV